MPSYATLATQARALAQVLDHLAGLEAYVTALTPPPASAIPYSGVALLDADLASALDRVGADAGTMRSRVEALLGPARVEAARLAQEIRAALVPA